MKIAITGHTQGLGQAFFKYFQLHTVIGFSRSNGYNIANPADRNKILDEIKDFDIFINNAYNNYDDSQLQLLMDVYNIWKGTDKIIINISSRYTNGTEKYCKDKEQQDLFCTNRVKHLQGDRLAVTDVVAVLNFVLSNNFKIHSVTFGK